MGDAIFDNLLDANPTVNTLIVIVMIFTISLSISFMINKKQLSFPVIFAFMGLILIYLYAYGVLPAIYGAGGFIINAILLVMVMHGGKGE